MCLLREKIKRVDRTLRLPPYFDCIESNFIQPIRHNIPATCSLHLAALLKLEQRVKGNLRIPSFAQGILRAKKSDLDRNAGQIQDPNAKIRPSPMFKAISGFKAGILRVELATCVRESIFLPLPKKTTGKTNHQLTRPVSP
ncbi:hypothetical protein J6590_085552 [Homalodisca vitripennis]|nr:hypothetical protein J6590_085552 [Homalodisca vitripennis]